MKAYFLYTLIIFPFIFSCSRNKDIIVTDVKKPFVDEIVISKNYNYTSYTIKIEGYVDDTIKVNDVKLCNKIDTIIRNDYYGGDKVIVLSYQPYRAKKGKLKINHFAR